MYRYNSLVKLYIHMIRENVDGIGSRIEALKKWRIF